MLSPQPVSHPDCCLSLSIQVLNVLATHLSEHPGLTLSIGSGTGLLEKLLTAHYPKLHIQGVEVRADQAVNKYLPQEDMFTIIGSIGAGRACERASVAPTWMFVYPRSPLLVRNYVRDYSDGSVKRILWLGPKNDWPDFAPSFETSDFESPHEIADCGLPAYETMMVIQKKAICQR